SAKNRLVTASKYGVQNARLEVWTPGKTKSRRKVLVSGSITLLTISQQAEECRGVLDYVWLEEISVSGNAENTFLAGPRVDQVVVNRRRIYLPPESIT